MAPNPFRPIARALLIFTLALTGANANVETPGARADRAFRIGFGPTEPSTLNPLKLEGQDALLIHSYVLESLLVPDEETYEWRPALAERYEVSLDGQAIDFTLRENARWSDGVPVTAADVEFSFAAIFRPEYPLTFLRPFYQSFSRVEVISPRRVRFHVKQPYFGNLIQSASLKILPKHLIEGHGDDPKLAESFVGSGPYVIERWTHGRDVQLKRNPHWWGRRDPYWKNAYLPKRVSFVFTNDDATELEMLERGELDYAELNPETYQRLRAAGRTPTTYQFQEVENAAPANFTAIILNLDDPLFSDRRVRLALNLMVDRDQMIRHLYGGLAIKSTGPWYRRSPYADANAGEISFDPARALALLREVGWRDEGGEYLVREVDGRTVPFRFTALAASPRAMRELTMIKEFAARIGVGIDIRRIDSGSLSRALGGRDFRAAAWGEGGGWVTFDPRASWASSSARAGGANFSGYRDAVADRLIERIGVTQDEPTRRALMKTLYARIARDVPYIFLLNDRANVYAVSNRVVRPRPFYRFGTGLARMALRGDQPR